MSITIYTDGTISVGTTHPGAAKKETTMSTVLLTSGTVGTTSTEAAVGDTVTVTLHDENGNGITETGTVEEVLE